MNKNVWTAFGVSAYLSTQSLNGYYYSGIYIHMFFRIALTVGDR